MSTYFAHSTDNPTKSDWQPLNRHLVEVGRRSGEFAARFGAEEWGRACGLLHDLGKFSREFQARLEGGRRVDHATAGARQARDRYGLRIGDGHEIIGLSLARCRVRSGRLPRGGVD